MSSMESVLDKLISLVESKEDRKKTLEVIKKQGTEGLLYDIVEELTDEDDVLPYDAQMDSRMTRQERLSWNRSNQNSRIQPKMYDRSEAEKNSRVLYIFTDNTDRTSGSGVIDDNSWYANEYGKGLHYPTKTSAVVRGLDNARPVSTQRWYHEGAKGETGRWNDSDFDEFKKVVDKEFQDIFDAWNSGQYDYIYVPANVQSEDLYTNGIFNGKISQLTEERTPRLYHYLQDKMMDLNELVSGVKSPTVINSVEDAIQVLENPEFTPKEAPANAEEAEKRGESVFKAPKGFTYRPNYKFGRIYLTENDKKYVKESVKFTILGFEIKQKEIDDLQWLYDNRQILDSYINGETPTLQPNEYVKDIINYFGESSEMIYENMADDGKVNGLLNKLAQLYHDHEDGFGLIKFIDEEVVNDGMYVAINNFLGKSDKITNVNDMLYDIVAELSNDVDNETYASYSYSDSRQLELFRKQYQKPMSVMLSIDELKSIGKDLMDKCGW